MAEKWLPEWNPTATSTPASCSGVVVSDSGGTQIPDGVTAYACPHIRPCSALDAILTAQWQAELISHSRPDSMSSNAPF